MRIFRYQLAVFVVVLLVGGLPVARAQQEVSFAGKEITLLVPFKAGGGTDSWARFWAPLIAERLPGKPQIKVRNVVGGGSTKGANQFARTAKNDGLTLLASSASVLFPYLLGDGRVQYDYHDWHALLVSPTGGIVFAKPELVDGLNQIKPDQQLKLLLQGPSQLGVVLMLSVDLLGLDYSVDFGASGSSATLRSFSRGLINIDIATTPSFIKDVSAMVDRSEARPLFSVGMVIDGRRVVRDSTFPDYPTFFEYLQARNKGILPASTMLDLWREFFEAGFPTQKMLIVPDGAPGAIKEAYVAAISEVIADGSLMPAARENVLGQYPQYVGAEAQELMLSATEMSPELRDWYKNWVFEKFNIKI